MQVNAKVSCVHGLKELILLKCYVPKAMYRFNDIPIKITMWFCTDIEIKIENKRSQIAKEIEKDQNWRHHFFWLQN